MPAFPADFLDSTQFKSGRFTCGARSSPSERADLADWGDEATPSRHPIEPPTAAEWREAVIASSFLTSSAFGADVAVARGLITCAVPPEDLDEAASTTLRELAGCER